MSTNRLKVLLVSLLAVFAVGAVASASSSAFLLEWEGCKNVGAATGEFNSATCQVKGGNKEWNWVKEAAGETWEIIGVIGESKLTVGTKIITCKKGKSVGKTQAAGAGEATTITFEECTTTEPACKVKGGGGVAGTIIVKGVPTKLVEREPKGGGAKKLANEFKQNATTKEFVTLKFEGTCPSYSETKVKGQVASEVSNLTNGEVELKFPSPELKGNTLEAFGVAATLTGKTTFLWRNEAGKIFGVRAV
jgi:hypothetical protein